MNDTHTRSGTLVRWQHGSTVSFGWVSWANLPQKGDHVHLTENEQKDSTLPSGTYEIVRKLIDQPEISDIPVYVIELVRRAEARTI